MRVILAGGGTAGHINPALAIAQEIKRRRPDSEILFVGNRDSLEDMLVRRAGFEIRYIKIQGLNRSKLYKNFTTAKLLISSVKEAKKIIGEFDPDVVIGTGGYVSGPVLYAASSMKKPTCIHEQNAYPGLTSRMLSKKVDRIFISFEHSAKYFKPQNKLILTGNPLRHEFSALDRQRSREELGLKKEDFYVLSFGGSLGATVLNNVMCDIFEKNKADGKLIHCHSMGKMGARQMPEQLRQRGIPVGENSGTFRILDYIYDMPRQIAAADVVIARAGAITIGELLAQGKAAILIPSPNVTHNHQFHNAFALVQNNAALMIEEKDLSSEKLYEMLTDLKMDQNKRRSLSKCAFEMAKAKAAVEIVDHIEALLNTK